MTLLLTDWDLHFFYCHHLHVPVILAKQLTLSVTICLMSGMRPARTH